MTIVDLVLGADAAYVGFLENVVKVGVLVYAVDDVLEYLLLAGREVRASCRT